MWPTKESSPFLEGREGGREGRERGRKEKRGERVERGIQCPIPSAPFNTL